MGIGQNVRVSTSYLVKRYVLQISHQNFGCSVLQGHGHCGSVLSGGDCSKSGPFSVRSDQTDQKIRRCKLKTRRARLKSALYLRLKKRKRLFFEKKLEIFEFFFFQKPSHSAEKSERGDPLGFINIYSVAKYEKTRRGSLLRHWNFFEKKVAQCRKKVQSGDPLGTSGFVGYVKIVKNERGDPFALISADRAWPYTSSFSSFDCKKSGSIRVRL